ncbi:MAG: PAS domain S-box protein [Nitrospirales bacterium]
MRPIVKAVFQPGIQMMSQLRYAHKFALISCLFVLPLTISMYLGIKEINNTIEFTEKQLAGTHYLRGIQRMLADLQTHRGMMEARMSANQSFGDKVEKIESAIHTDLQHLDALDRRFGALLDTTQFLSKIQHHWQRLNKEESARLSRSEVFEYHTTLIDLLLQLIAHVGDHSNLILDPSLHSYYLMEGIVVQLPQWREALGQIRGEGTGIISRGIITDQERIQFYHLKRRLEDISKTARRNFTVAFQANPAFRDSFNPVLQETLRLSNNVIRMANNMWPEREKLFQPPTDFWDTATTALNSVLRLETIVLPVLEETLNTRLSAGMNRKSTLQVVTLVSLLLVLYMLVSFYLSTILKVKQMRDVSHRLLKGDLQQTDFSATGNDEMMEAVQAFNQVAGIVRSQWLAAEAETTKARKAEAKAGESEGRLRAIMDGVADGLITMNEHGIVESWNGTASKIFGYDPEEISGHNISQLLPTLRSVHDLNQDLETDEGSPVNTRQEGTGKRKDGTRFPIDIRLSKVPWDDRHLFTGIIRDLSDQKAMESALRKSHRLNQELLASISSILISVDGLGRITQWNATAENILGISATTVKGKSFHTCGIEWDWPLINEGIRQCLDTQQIIHLDNLPYTHPSGKKGFLGITITPIRGEEAGKISEFLVVGADITEKKHLQGQLALAQKMEAIGQLAAGIAHEINTPTQFVGDNLRFLIESFRDIQAVLNIYGQVIQALPRDAVDAQLLHTLVTTLAETDLEYVSREIPKALQQSLDGSERVGNIVRAMKEFSHPGRAEKKPMDLNHAIESTVAVARNEWKYVADVVTDLDPTLPLVPGLPGEFNQVILNLLINAAHAIGAAKGRESDGKGTITITTQKAAEGIEIRITDTGTGIPEVAREKIFDPFYTTKEVGQGTGQGLAIAHDVIVNKHEGHLTFETAVGTGTTFIIWLPCTKISMVVEETR